MKEEILAERLGVLGHPQRLRLFMMLGESPLYVIEIAGKLGTSQSSVSHYLKDMKNAGLVKKERKENRTYYSLSEEGVRLYEKIKELVKE